MPRPADWEARALAWFRALPGEKRSAVVRLLDPNTPEGQQFARLVYDCMDESEKELQHRRFQEEGKPAIKEFWGWLTKQGKLATVIFLLLPGGGLRRF